MTDDDELRGFIERGQRAPDLVIAAEKLRRQEFARLSQAVTPRIEAFRAMTADAFRAEISAMLERLGHTIISSISDIVTTKGAQKFIVACAAPVDKTTKTPALRRLHDSVVAGGATRGIYVTPREFTPEAEHYAASAPIDLVDGALLIKSMHRSRKGLLLPSSYKAMCCQCGDIVRHTLDKADAVPCGNGHPVAPTIARAALVPYRPDPSEQPAAAARPKPSRVIRPGGMSAKAQRRRKIKAHNNRRRSRALKHPGPGPHPRMR
jgi:Restriction endonuclease